MFKKRGQLTLFVIIGIMVVALIVGFFLLQKPKNETFENPKIAVLRDNSLNCLNQVYITSLTIVGFQGGYIEVKDGKNNGFSNIPYYYKKGNLNIPSIEKIENEIARYVDIAAPYCLDYSNVYASSEQLEFNLTNLDVLEGNFSGYQTSYNQKGVDVEIKNGEIVFTNDINLIVKDDLGTSHVVGFRDSPIIYDSDLFEMHKIAKHYTTSLLEDNEEACLSCVFEIAEESGLSIDIMEYMNPGDELVVISNNITSIPIVFQFLNKYSEVSNAQDELF
jgi:hypothetical protein